jgi:hypothetical protein
MLLVRDEAWILAFSADGRFLATGEADGRGAAAIDNPVMTVRDLTSQQVVTTLPATDSTAPQHRVSRTAHPRQPLA